METSQGPMVPTSMLCGKSVREARGLFHLGRDQYETRVQELDKRDSKLTEREESLTARNGELGMRERELTDKLASLDEREGTVSDQEVALTKREVEIRRREVNAEHDFDVERKAMLSKFNESVAEHRAELEKTECEIIEKRTAWHEEERKKRAELHTQLDEKREAFPRTTRRSGAGGRETTGGKRKGA